MVPARERQRSLSVREAAKLAAGVVALVLGLVLVLASHGSSNPQSCISCYSSRRRSRSWRGALSPEDGSCQNSFA